MYLHNSKAGTHLGPSFGLALLIAVIIAGLGLSSFSQWRRAAELNWVRSRAALLDIDAARQPLWHAEIAKVNAFIQAARKAAKELIVSDKRRQILANVDKTAGADAGAWVGSRPKTAALRHPPASAGTHQATARNDGDWETL